MVRISEAFRVRALSFFASTRLNEWAAMFQSSRAGEIVRFVLLTACLVLAPQLGIVSAQDVPQIAGTWRGDSVCVVPNTPCQNEVNVYRFSEILGKANRFSCTAAKIVGGKEIAMGSGEWSYDSSKHILQTVPNPTIRLVLDHDVLDGALILPNSTIYRRIHLKKSTDKWRPATKSNCADHFGQR